MTATHLHRYNLLATWLTDESLPIRGTALALHTTIFSVSYHALQRVSGQLSKKLGAQNKGCPTGWSLAEFFDTYRTHMYITFSTMYILHSSHTTYTLKGCVDLHVCLYSAIMNFHQISWNSIVWLWPSWCLSFHHLSFLTTNLYFNLWNSWWTHHNP